MKKLILKLRVVHVALFMLIAACQKDYAPDIEPLTPSGNGNKVKTYSETLTLPNGTRVSDTSTLTYDSQGRILSLTSTVTPGNKLLFQYNTNNTYTMDIFVANKLSTHEIFYLNNIPYVDSTLQYEVGRNDTITEKYIYNSNSQWVMLKEYDYSKATGSVLRGVTTFSYDGNGNQVKEQSSSGTVTYDYYPDLPNTLMLGFVYFYQNKNMVKTETHVGGSNQVITHTYTFDNRNRLVTDKSTSNDGRSIVKSFTY